MKNAIIKQYGDFNFRRYSNPWVAKVAPNGKLDFSVKVGGYTGRYNAGEAGSLYVTDPVEGTVYAYGRKDYRGGNGGYQYVQYVNGEFVPVDAADLLKALNPA